MSDIPIKRGNTTKFDVFCTRLNPTTGMVEAVNLTGAKAWLTIKKDRRDLDAAAVYQKDSTAHPSIVQLIDPINGKIRITIPAADSASFPAVSLPYDIQVREANTEISTPVQGYAQVERDVTITTSP